MAPGHKWAQEAKDYSSKWARRRLEGLAATQFRFPQQLEDEIRTGPLKCGNFISACRIERNEALRGSGR